MSRREAVNGALGIVGVLGVTALYARLQATNSTTVALTFMLVVLSVAATSRLWSAAVTSVVAVLCFNFFFLPPVRTWTIADPQNWVALFVFLAVSLVASNLSAAVRAREREALDRRDEVARLFDVSRDVLMIHETRDATRALARVVGRRFGLDYVAICQRAGERWEIAERGALSAPIPVDVLAEAERDATRILEFDATTRTYAGHRTVGVGETPVRLVPLRAGARPIGLLACAGRIVDAGTLDALAGVVAIAIERVQFLEERKSAELARQSEALKATLLASLGHDLRTPLTAIRVAAANLRESWPNESERREQGDVILLEVERLTRLFQNTVDIARIDAAGVNAASRWVHLSELFEAARDQVGQMLQNIPLHLDIVDDAPVWLDPRLTAAALAHVLENAVRYSPGAPVTVRLTVVDSALTIEVEDQGVGIAADDLPHLFERFYRGAAARRVTAGTGMGLAIAAGFLAAQNGRIEAENVPSGGARFTIVVPVQHGRPARTEE
jgi:two-component system sensor histidine kinase KdpD